MSNLLFYSTMTLITLTLIQPLLYPASPIQNMKLATMLSLTQTTIFLYSNTNSITTNFIWTNSLFNLQASFLFDCYTMLFLPISIFITWSILQFTSWYMHSDPNQKTFMKYLLLFLLAMLTLTTANNLVQLFVGWEAVGIMSFLLIGWWHARTNANTSALQAIIYNRIGDIGLLLSMAWLAMNLNTLEMQQLFSHNISPTLPGLGLILAAMGKSAQFGLHPWLPSAMEGPTPVSALLHSSTMVVAGIYLLIRLHPLLQHNPVSLSLCLCIGAMTTTFAALCAITQNDLKKIIAFSTSSQLGLMMLTVGLNQPELAFLHITTHAFFKAMLFLCSGSIIHNLNDEQDIRKMGATQKTLPITTSCMTLGSLALMGAPFLAGFYTKDAIIEAMNTSTINAWALSTTLLATILTTAYSLRLTFYTQLHKPRYHSITHLMESNKDQINPILRLAMASILAGLVITSSVLPTVTQTMTMPMATKISATLALLLGLLCTIDLLQHTSFLTNPPKTTLHQNLTQLMFFNITNHRLLPMTTLTSARSMAMQLNDMTWYEHIGPMMAKTYNIKLATTLSTTNTGLIKTYLTTPLLLLVTCLILLAL
uniref:NADH-ubiquinone oxidoreductase chain 5 n=1 Tax=Heteronotia binoei TaxID=13085 RepID=A9XSL1_9SAUR|nr:NADH dehydrogenase subunit 5 [Heteronotia binoei]